MKKKPYVCIVFLLLVAACTHSGQNIEEKLLVERDFSITAGDELDLTIHNTTGECIKFSPGYGLQLRAFIGDDVVEVDNLIQYTGADTILSPDKDSLSSKDVIWIKPDLSNVIITSQTLFEARLIGRLCDDETSEVVKVIFFSVYPPK